MRPDDFWNSIPKEFNYVYEAWTKSEEDNLKSEWERTRMICYYSFLGIPKKRANPSIEQFKREYLTFPWDETIKKTDKERGDEEQPISPNEWFDIINKLTPGKKVDLKAVKEIKRGS